MLGPSTRALSCRRCQQRKIKCDRSFPCASCEKAGVQCAPTGFARRPTLPRPAQVLKKRVELCEQRLLAYANHIPSLPSNGFHQPQPSGTGESHLDEEFSQWTPFSRPRGKLVEDRNGSVVFMDNFLAQSIHEELRTIRGLIDSYDHPSQENIDNDTPLFQSPLDPDFLLGDDIQPLWITESLWPESHHVFRLWQIYLDRVHPLTKIVHAPSLQPTLVDASSGRAAVSMNIQALLLAIFLMAIVAMSEEECARLIGLPKEEALRQFSAETQRALQRSEYLKTRNLTVIQALVLYMMSLQGRLDRHALWSLNGVVIRIAQKNGMHQDGELLGLSPFESEMRRRVWWQIIILDAKYAISSGFGHSLLPRHSSTSKPKNLNDVDIYPDASSPYRDCEGPTEMVLCHIMYEVASFLQQTPGLEPVSIIGELKNTPNGDSNRTDDGHNNYFKARFRDLEQQIILLRDKYCNPSRGCTHQMASIVITHILEHTEFLFRLPQPQGQPQSQLDNDIVVTLAITELELHTSVAAASKDMGFAWFTSVNMPLDTLIFVVKRLDWHAEGDLVNRAWKQCELSYALHPELFSMESERNRALADLILRAWIKKTGRFREHDDQYLNCPEFIRKIQNSYAMDTSYDVTDDMASAIGFGIFSLGTL